jgi:hypothetical protein
MADIPKQIGQTLGNALSNVASYPQDFIETDLDAGINLSSVDSVNLATSLYVCRQDVGTAFIIGHSVNGKLADTNYTLGIAGLGARTCFLLYIGTDLYYLFQESFSFTTYQSSGTANWNTTLGRLAMTSLATHLPKVTYQDIGTFTIDGTTAISTVRVTATETRWNSTDKIKYFISTDSKATWTEVTLGTDTTISGSGTTGYVRVTFQGNGNKDTYIDDLQVLYT